MNTYFFRWLRWPFILLAFAMPVLAAAQTASKQFSKEQLDQMTAQIALYPDALLAQVLMASTYPADVAEAAKWSRAHSEEKGDAAVEKVQDQPWDPSVKSLVAFPQVAIMMGEKPDWVKDLGDAFLAQPDEVMNSVQRLRVAAQKAGNLKSNEQVAVTTEKPDDPGPSSPPQVIVIEQKNPEVVYVPSYNPTVVYGAWPYPAYPPYYVPYPPGYWFSGAVMTGIAWGVGIAAGAALWGGCNWGRGDVNVNVNRYNNINRNNQIDRGNSKWSHNTANRGNTPYRGGDAQRQNLQRQASAADRQQYRGKDADRARAQQSLQSRGVDTNRSSLSDANRSNLQQQARSQGMDRGGGAGGMDRAGAGAGNRGGASAGSYDRGGGGAGRNDAFQGAGSRSAGSEMNRGASSNRSAQQMQRSSGGGGASRPSGGGGGGGARSGGGGGGARGGGGGGGGRGGGGGGRGGGGRR